MVLHRTGSMMNGHPPPPPPQEAPMSKNVLYIGSAVPLETSTGIEAIQQPLRSRYPVDDEDIQGIPSILTVLPSGLQLKYVDDPTHVIFFPYSALNLCAAVRCVHNTNTATGETVNRFVSLTEAPDSHRPAIFTTITRRTQGRHVLECSGFLTKNPSDALDLVQWTSELDKRSKMNGGGFLSMGGAASSNSNVTSHDVNKTADASFHTDASPPPPETPINIVSGNTLGKVGSYTELPKTGYFYTTENAQVKKFSLHKFSYEPPSATPQQHAVKIQAGQPVMESIPISTVKASEPVVEESQHDRSFVNGDHHFDKRSTYSIPVNSRAPRLIAVRGPPPPGSTILMRPPAPRPVLVARSGPPPVQPVLIRGPAPAHPAMVQPAFYPVAPPAAHRAQPVPMMMPVPMAYPPNATATLPKNKPRRSPSADSVSTAKSGPSHVQPMLVRGPAPTHPVMVQPAFYPMAQPGAGRVHPVPMMMPVPMGYPPNQTATLPKNKPRRSPSADSTSSSTSSDGRPRRYNHNHTNQIVRRDHSFDLSSRPVTPPTDYDSPPSQRHSRREEYHSRQAVMNNYPGGAATLLPPGRGMPPGYVMLPVGANGAVYGAPTLPRSKSVPENMDKKSKKKSKNKKKSKKEKNKDKKKNMDAHYVGGGAFNDENEEYGYASDMVPPAGLFGKSSRSPYGDTNLGATKTNPFGESSRNLGESQYQRSFSKNAAERAFSTSLAAETRKSTRGGHSFNAYAMNQNGVGDGEFPTMR